jgi:hypothetical protein
MRLLYVTAELAPQGWRFPILVECGFRSDGRYSTRVEEEEAEEEEERGEDEVGMLRVRGGIENAAAAIGHGESFAAAAQPPH